MTDLPDECDYCDQPLEEDEELEPVYIGKPTARPQRLERTKNKSDTFEYQLHGRSVSAHAALYELLENADNIHVKLSDSVMECNPTNTIGKADTEKSGMGFNANVNRDKAGAKVIITPDLDIGEPDLMVCPYCMESLSKEGDPV